MDPHLRTLLASLGKAARSVGLQNLAKLLDHFFTQRTPAVHEQWNKETRTPIAELTVSSISQQHSSPEELTDEGLAQLKAMPLLKGNSSWRQG